MADPFDVDALLDNAAAVSERTTRRPPDTALTVLTQAWLNERAAPELLHYEAAAVTSLQRQVDAQMARIDALRDHLSPATATSDTLTATLYQTEVERVRFVLRSYLRARLYKLERHALYALRDPDYRRRLSESEVQYAQEFQQLVETSFSESALQDIPESLRQLDDTKMNMIPQPDMDDPVFCRALENIGEVQLDDQMDSIEMERGNIFLLRYSYVRQLVAEQRVALL